MTLTFIVDIFAAYVHSNCICHLEDFTVSKLLNK